MLRAIDRVLTANRTFWPLSDRQIRYQQLNDPPLSHANKPGSVYRNDHKSYKSLCELLTRARLAGRVPFSAIADPTRDVTTWATHHGVGTYVRQELDNFLKGYHRDLMRSQPAHVEIMGEKNTVASIIRPVASRYTIPFTIGRGYCSLPPRVEMAERCRRSGKDTLVILFLSDFDPEGENIPTASAGRCGTTSVSPGWTWSRWP